MLLPISSLLCRRRQISHGPFFQSGVRGTKPSLSLFQPKINLEKNGTDRPQHARPNGGWVTSSCPTTPLLWAWEGVPRCWNVLG